MNLIIATKNKSKFSSIKSLITKIDDNKKFKVSQISSKIPDVKETGKSSKENCLIKIKHYRKYVKDPFIVCDDEIDFVKAGGNLNFGHRFHGLGTNSDKENIEIFKYVQNYLLKNNKVTMIRTRYYGLVNRQKHTIFTDKFKANLTFLDKITFTKILSNNVLDNPLNHFIIQDKQKTKYLVYNTQKKIGNFLKNI